MSERHRPIHTTAIDSEMELTSSHLALALRHLTLTVHPSYVPYVLDEDAEGFALASRLDDGSVGYFMPPDRADMCFVTCLATVLRVPLAQVPDAEIDDQLRNGVDANDIDTRAWADLDAWAEDRGFEIVMHVDPPWHLPLWIGVAPCDGEDYLDHCVVMAGASVLHDPATNAVLLHRGKVVAVIDKIDTTRIVRGIELKRIERKENDA